jgi:hypothetical protein
MTVVTWKSALLSLRRLITWQSAIIDSLINAEQVNGPTAERYYRSNFLALRQAIRWHRRIDETLTSYGWILSSIERDRLLYIILKHARRARYVDTMRVADELVHHPNFLNRRGSIAKLLELHAQRSSREAGIISRIPETLCQPTIVEFTASDERYYLSKLFTQEHFSQESAVLHHCLGTTYLEHYLSLSLKGEVEIFSLRETGTHKPVVTIEYHAGTKRIAQLKAQRNQLIKRADPFFAATMEAIGYLRNGIAFDRHGTPYLRGVTTVADLDHLRSHSSPPGARR